MEASKALLKSVAELKERGERRRRGLFVAEGFNLVRDAGVRARMAFVCEDCADDNISVEADELYVISRDRLKKISDTVTPQGVVGVYEMPDTSVREPLGRALILDGISDPGNLGTLIRTAAATGYSDVYLIDCADAYSHKAVRSSMGGIFRVRVHEGHAEDVVELLKGLGYKVAALDMSGEDIFGYAPTAGIDTAVVVGSEAHGVSPYIREHADVTVSLPMSGDMESLNAAVAGGIAMYLLRYINKQQEDFSKCLDTANGTTFRPKRARPIRHVPMCLPR